jgi:hypothetical protein
MKSNMDKNELNSHSDIFNTFKRFYFNNKIKDLINNVSSSHFPITNLGRMDYHYREILKLFRDT